MSDADGIRRDGRWVEAVAASRGVLLAPGRAEEIAASVAPTLRAFADLAGELCADDDVHELRRLLAAEAGRR